MFVPSTTRLFRIGLLVALALAVAPRAAGGDERGTDRSAERNAMVEEIAADAAATVRSATGEGFDARVLEAMRAVPRHRFVPPAEAAAAYENRPLPIGYGQTISQPYIVALMTDLLRPRAGARVLELGTGSGYQAAVLARLVDRVYTIEIVEPLATQAREQLEALGIENVEVRHGDGYYGWEEHAPFDAIIVTAAAASIPPPLIAQLSPGGRMVIPVGAPFLTQNLVLVEKDADGRIGTRQLMPVRFVPLTRGD